MISRPSFKTTPSNTSSANSCSPRQRPLSEIREGVVWARSMDGAVVEFRFLLGDGTGEFLEAIVGCPLEDIQWDQWIMRRTGGDPGSFYTPFAWSTGLFYASATPSAMSMGSRSPIGVRMET